MINPKTILFLFVVLLFCNNCFSVMPQNKHDLELTYDNDSNLIHHYKSPVNFFYAEFDTIANFWGSQFDSVADFRYAKFIKLANFRKGIFCALANFKNAEFYSDVFFTNRTFNSEANFSNVHFMSETKFLLTQFNSSVNFSLAHFDSLSDFANAIFDSCSDFRRAEFNSLANFTGVEFKNSPDFSNVNFKSGANFNKVKFYSDVSFAGAQFDSIVDYRFVRFDSLVDFGNTKFNSDVYFDSTLLPNYLSFQNAQEINNEIDLTNTRINPNYSACNINLINANIDKIRFRYSRFNLYFPKGTGPDIKSNVYEGLLIKLQKEGFTASFEKLDKEYLEFKYLENSGNGDWERIVNWINKHWWGYGYDKELIIRNTLILFCIFLIINFGFFNDMVNKVYRIEQFSYSKKEINFLLDNNTPKIIFIAILYTAFIFFGLKFNRKDIKIKENLTGWRFLFLINFFTQFIVGLICLAYLANFIITT